MNSPKDSGGSPMPARVPLLLLPPTLLQGFQFPGLLRAQVPGHEGTNGHLGGLIVVVIVDESLIAAGSRWVHGVFPARSLANVVDVAVAGPQPAGVVEVSVLLEYLLRQPTPGSLRSSSAPGWAADGWSGPLNSQSSRRHIAVFSRSPETVMRRAFRRECRLTSRATFFFAQDTTFV